MGSADFSVAFANQAIEAISADAVIVGVFKTSAKPERSQKAAPVKTPSYQHTPELTRLDAALQGMLAVAAKEEKFDASAGKILAFRKSPSYQIKARRIILVGLGEAHKLKAADLDKALLKAMASAQTLDGLSHVAVVVPNASEKISSDVTIHTLIDAVAQSTYKSAEAKDAKQSLAKVTLLLDRPATTAQKEAAAVGRIMARAKSLAKDLVNKPSNLKTTDTLVQVARGLAKKSNITVNIQSNVSWIKKEMPCFYAVAQGSLASDPPKFIQIKYTPKTGSVKKKIALVGKSVIFDTGGYQVKTGNFMNTMKGDMTGGAIMLGTMTALAELQLPGIEVTAYMAATPNKIDSDAFIPDSIYPTTCGKKVEIRHTDAEGRLTLIDAVAKAAANKPDEIVTMATLTGSASQAVGMAIALMGNNDELVERVHQAGVTQGEPIQTLNVIEDDYQNIKSKLDGADIINTSQRKNRGAQTAAAFVMSGAPEGMPMAHMDIAGADMTPDEKATGIGQKLMIQYLISESARASTSRASSASARSSSSTAKGRGSRTTSASPARKSKRKK